MKAPLTYKKSKNLLSTNAKLEKSVEGYLIYGLQLAPHTQAGIGNVCPSASEGCAAACLFSAGMGKFSNVKQARIDKTRYFFYETKVFIAQIAKEIIRLEKKAAKQGKKLAIRLNTISDIAWEKVRFSDGSNLFQMFPSVTYYDYTKVFKRAMAHANGELPANYSLTFSRSESNQAHVDQILAAGGNVAAVFEDLPETYKGVKVIDGDVSDARFLDEKGIVVGLVAKGDGKKDSSGFVIPSCLATKARAIKSKQAEKLDNAKQMAEAGA